MKDTKKDLLDKWNELDKVKSQNRKNEKKLKLSIKSEIDDNKPKFRYCLFSGEKFYPKRNNQVFASKKNRTTYHNDINNKTRHELKEINSKLTNNFKICKELVNVVTDKKQFHVEFLKGKGFDFDSFTGLIEVENVNIFIVYNFSFQKINTDFYQIQKNA